MAQKTTLSPSATPGRTYNFVAKEMAAPVEIPTISVVLYGPNPNAIAYGPNPNAILEAN